MPSLPLVVSCFSKIQIGFTFLIPAHPGSPGQRAIKWVCSVCKGSLTIALYNRTKVLLFICIKFLLMTPKTL